MHRADYYIRTHRNHAIGAILLAVAIFAALTAGHHFGMGAIAIQPLRLAGGLFVAEAGELLTAFGVKKRNRTAEYLGLFAQGLAWWIWSLNFDFVERLHGKKYAINFLGSAALICLMPPVAHYLAQLTLAFTARIRGISWSQRRELVTGAAVASLSIFAALTIAQYAQIGGIRVHPGILLLGLLIAESGEFMTAMGVKSRARSLEYGGLLLQGAAWWVWSLNLGLLEHFDGVRTLQHLLLSLLLIGVLPATVHYVGLELLAALSGRLIRFK